MQPLSVCQIMNDKDQKNTTMSEITALDSNIFTYTALGSVLHKHYHRYPSKSLGNKLGSWYHLIEASNNNSNNKMLKRQGRAAFMYYKILYPMLDTAQISCCMLSMINHRETWGVFKGHNPRLLSSVLANIPFFMAPRPPRAQHLYLPIGGLSLVHWCNGWGVHTIGSQRDGSQWGGIALTLFPLVRHECWQWVELLLALSTKEHILIICN